MAHLQRKSFSPSNPTFVFKIQVKCIIELLTRDTSCPSWSWCCLYPDIPLGSLQPPGLSFTPDTSLCIRTGKGGWGLTDVLYVGIQICAMCCLHCCLSPSGQGTETLARRCKRALCYSTCSPEIRDHLLRKLVQL